MTEPLIRRGDSGLRTILKYAINLDTMAAQHAIPAESTFLDLQVQDGTPVMWWSVPTNALRFPASWPLRSFQVAPTGGPGYTENLHYVGTFQIGGFVGHVLSSEEFDRA